MFTQRSKRGALWEQVGGEHWAGAGKPLVWSKGSDRAGQVFQRLKKPRSRWYIALNAKIRSLRRCTRGTMKAKFQEWQKSVGCLELGIHSKKKSQLEILTQKCRQHRKFSAR